MERDRFESEIIELASQGVPITVANVASRMKLPPRKAEAMLDEMIRSGHLDSEIDEREAVLVYKVRGLTTGKRKRVLVDTDDDDDDRSNPIARAAGEVLVRQAKSTAKKVVLDRKEGEKSVLVGLGLGFFLGPIGLLYAAPWMVGIVSVLVYAIAWKIPLVSSLLAALLAILHIGFAIVSALYVLRYNKSGKRAPLLPKETEAR